jgi:MFS family permease
MATQVTRVPTFQVIIVQGILGSTPWNALVFLTVYLQLLGFNNADASLVLSLFLGGAALGGVVGGTIGDWAARLSHNHGRIFVCQFSVFMGIPFSLLIIKGLPHNGEPLSVALYAITVFWFGVLHVWAAPACNNPIFAEIVPAHLRNLAYAFDRCSTICGLHVCPLLYA